MSEPTYSDLLGRIAYFHYMELLEKQPKRKQIKRKIVKEKEKKKCLRETCENLTSHNGGYCSVECYRCDHEHDKKG